ATVLDLVDDLRREFDTAIMFISHNLGVIARVCDRVAVMYAGEVVEIASVHELFANPRHPYTQGLIRCVPRLGRSKASSVLYPIPGRVPSPDNQPAGCTFEPRCDYAHESCRAKRVPLREFQPNHRVRCLFAEEIDASQWTPSEPITPLAQASRDAEPILDVDSLKTYYRQASSSALSLVGLAKPRYLKAVDDVSFSLPKGITLGVVGESGCGKSTLIKTIIGLEELSGGKIEFMSVDLGIKVNKRDMATIRELQMVFQNPNATMNPSYPIGRQLERPLRRFKIVPPSEIRAEVVRLLRAVKLDEHYYDRLPNQLSGGEKQRVGIARAFAGRPDLVLCDEPVSALDVSVQAAVLNLLAEIQQQQKTTLLMIAH
ncbi:MAG: ABC transporter ATP-binding protein, partial [Chloroflexia bacterium]|nr:ABC transporter ATP-binding protein [Chloroflexia bacterium]